VPWGTPPIRVDVPEARPVGARVSSLDDAFRYRPLPAGGAGSPVRAAPAGEARPATTAHTTSWKQEYEARERAAAARSGRGGDIGHGAGGGSLRASPARGRSRSWVHVGPRGGGPRGGGRPAGGAGAGGFPTRQLSGLFFDWDDYGDDEADAEREAMDIEALDMLDDELHLNTSQLSIFCVGNKTLLSIHDNPQVHADGVLAGRAGPAAAGAGGARGLSAEKWVARLRRQLGIANSKLRHGDAYFLLYALLDACVDQYFPVVEAFSRRIMLLERTLVNNPREEFDINRVNRIKRQLEMLHRLLRPVREVVRHCIDDMEAMAVNARKSSDKQSSVSTVVYLRDVYDHMQQVLDDCVTSIEACRSINDQSAQLRDMKMNEVMYFLTLVTTLFVPAEFLTGVYGMNFIDRESKLPTIPELLWPRGYMMFWMFFCTSFLGTLLYFRRRGWV
jgi:magnesium/cobalt transport protein CorA